MVGDRVQPGWRVDAAVSAVNPVGSVTFAEPRVVLLDASFVIVTVKFCGFTGSPAAGFVTATTTL